MTKTGKTGNDIGGTKSRLGSMRGALAAATLFCGGIVATDARAGACSNSSYGGADIDCAIILCLVGGFGPSECNPAYRCFWHRLTRTPPKPPIGFCPMGSMEGSGLDDDDRETFEATLKELESFGYPEGAASLRSVRATIYRFTKTCYRGKEQDEQYDCTATYQVNADGSQFRITDIAGHYRGKKIEFIDGFGLHQVVGDAEQKISTPYNCYRQGRGDGEVCSYRTHWQPIARPIQ